VEKNIVLIPNFVTKKFEQTVFQGFVSDKGYCTHSTTVDITYFIFRGVYAWVKILGRVSQKKFGASYPPVLVLRSPKGCVYLRLRNIGLELVRVSLMTRQS